MTDDNQEAEDPTPVEKARRPSLLPFALMACIVAAVYLLFFVPKPQPPTPALAQPESGSSSEAVRAPAAPSLPSTSRPSPPAADPVAVRPKSASAVASGPQVLTEASFRELGGSGVMVVDFWAEWCGPCRQQTPIISDLAGSFAADSRVIVAKVDVDREEALADRFGIRSIPTVVILKDGKEVKRFVGVTDERTLARAVRSAM